MTENQWEYLRESRPDLKLIPWDELGWMEQDAKRMKPDEVIAELTACALIGEEHNFTLDVPF